MFNTVMKYLRLSSAAFPGYSEVDSDAMNLKTAVFTEAFELNGLSEADVINGFRHHIGAGKKFPVPSDIINAVKPVTLYRMDNGPLGFNALYDASHPYVRQQVRLGLDISRCAETVSAAEPVVAKAKQQAEVAPHISYDNADDEVEIEIEPRRGSGWRRIGYEH